MKRRDCSSSDIRNGIGKQLEETSSIIASLADGETNRIFRMAEMIVDSYREGGTLFICGNGGSAADAQHMAGELVGRFLRERKPLSCIALTTDTSILTALGNDYGFESVFSRQVAAHGRKGDVLLAISTSGNSPNVLRAVEEARRLDMGVVALSGGDGGKLAPAADISVTIPSRVCPRIQEGHAAVIHVMCDVIERSLFGDREESA